MSITNDIEGIKSVNIKSTDIKRRLLMSSNMVKIFQSFLKESIGNEVIVINTNIGMEVYYYSSNDYSIFIKDSVILYTLKHINPAKLKFKCYLRREEVHQSFCEALFTFSQYPQIFLAYAKKFIRLIDINEDSRFVMPILNNFFEDTLQLLKETGKVPHYEKIQNEKNKSQKSDLNQKMIDNLISEILLKKHRN
ncbi:hypothetical protein [Aquimarina sp. 2201CG14-23]|uniref:hypothetical protein n=1 Tax=Aquimarina mycalae TaxID=3040073 RepID=UPI002477F03D|nr:hypothetical protein [Aquimarina sp. 2201CG14-23]MDH7445417.1 hypothetical protein [Aquimarina sp. 2201CG14-23]